MIVSILQDIMKIKCLGQEYYRPVGFIGNATEVVSWI